MSNGDEFYQPPGQQFEPGDVFVRMPFFSLKYPLSYWRMRQNDPASATLLDRGHSDPRPDTDSPKTSLDLQTVMLLSHGCEVDRVLRQEPPVRRHWLGAPIRPLRDCGDRTQERLRARTQPNGFYLPPSQFIGNEELYVDLRKITPITCQYFLDTNRLASLTQQAQKSLFAQLGVFFSGYALYLGPFNCPKCGTEIDASQFRLESVDEPHIE